MEASDDDSASSESGVANKEPPPTEAVTDSATEASFNGTKEELVANTFEAVGMQKSDEHSVSLCVVWLVNETESLTRHPGRNR